jgi:hypothetical protein
MDQSKYWLIGHRYLDMEVLDEDQVEIVEFSQLEDITNYLMHMME